MTVLQSGFAKSGNMLLHVILRSILELVGQEYKSVICSDPEWGALKSRHVFNSDLQPTIDVLDIEPNGQSRYIVSSFYQKPIHTLKSYTERCSIIWTHSEYSPMGFDNLFDLCSLNIYILRDPRAVLNSMAHYIVTNYCRVNFGYTQSTSEFLSDLETCRGVLRAWKRNVEGFTSLNKKKIQVIRYEDLVAEKGEWIGKITRKMGLLDRLSDEIVEEINRRSSPKVMKKKMPEHVRKCVNDDWKNNFSDDLVHLCRDEIGYLLETLEYE
jgi:Sulfotransferase domain